MDPKRFTSDIEACERAAARARTIGKVANALTLGLWANASGVRDAEQRVESARRDQDRLGGLVADLERLRAVLNESIEDHGVRVAVAIFADLELDGHRTYGPEWQSLRLRVLERDEYRCQHEDGRCRGPLQIHHRRPLSRGGTNELLNLLTLCRWHHGQQHPGNPAFQD